MKVIVAGYSKTGTKSMVVALSQLGYKVYDFVDHFWYHGDQWNKILNGRGSIDDFKEMYKDVDACTDGPAHHFWEEIHQAFPESKIILTTRDEDSWYKALRVQFDQFKKNYTYQIMQVFSPTGRRYFRFVQNCARTLYGWKMNYPHQIIDANEMIFKRNFRQAQTYCLQNAPKDKLLVYSVKEGWEPLCKFLGKDVPDKPFPHENIAGSILEEKMANDPVVLLMQREMTIVIILFLALAAAFVAWLIQYLTN